MQPLSPGEKHTPVIELNGKTVRVTVPNHPAQSEEHYIKNITLYKNEKVFISKDFTPEEEAVLEEEIEIPENGLIDLYATEYCNLHGEWNSEGKFLGEK